MKELKKLLGKNIQSARRKAGMSQEDLASKIGVQQSSVGRWETGKRKPTDDYINMICEVLNISRDDLIKEKENPDITIVGLSEQITRLNHENNNLKQRVISLENVPQDVIRGLIRYNRNWDIVRAVLGIPLGDTPSTPQPSKKRSQK